MAWAKVFGADFVPGFVKMFWASVAVFAAERSWTFSVSVRERSTTDSRCGGISLAAPSWRGGGAYVV